MRHRGCVIAILVAVIAFAGCAGDPDTDPADGPDADSGTGTATPPTTAPDGPFGIRELDFETIGTDNGRWAVKSAGDRLFGHHMLTDEPGTQRLVRFDPDSGAILAEVRRPDWEGAVATDAGFVILEADRRYVTVLDRDTLAQRHRIDLGADVTADLNIDVPRPTRMWFGTRRLLADQVAGRATHMGAIKVDLETGTLLERRDLPACGSGSAVEVEGLLVSAVQCAYQMVAVDLTTNESTLMEAFPASALLLEHGGAAFVRFSPLGYLARWRPGDDALTTLDLNAAGPTLSGLKGLRSHGGDLWTIGEQADDTLPGLLMRIDPYGFTVKARRWIDAADVAFVGETGYAQVDGLLVRFDPATVTEDAPTEVVRPKVGAPPAYQPRSPDERAVIAAMQAVYDPASPAADAAAHLAEPEITLETRNRLISLGAAIAPDIDPVVTAVAIDGDKASAAYSYLVGGKVAYVPLTATLTRVAGGWLVSRRSVCLLAAEAAVAC